MGEPRALVNADTLAREYVRRAKAPNPLRTYQSDWRHFTAWSDRQGAALGLDGALSRLLHLANTLTLAPCPRNHSPERDPVAPLP